MSKEKNNLILLQEYLLPSFNIEIEEEEEFVEQEEGTPPPPYQIAGIIEALLLATNKPLTVDKINQCLHHPGKNQVIDALRTLRTTWAEEERGIEIVEVSKGWQIRTHSKHSNWIQRLIEAKPKKLSKAALEALAIIAYRQPVTRTEVDQLRGVDSSAVIHTLLNFKLITTIGRRNDEQGKPLLLGTTDEFLSMFNLRDLVDLPTLRDLREIEIDKFTTPSDDKD
jgi:segregation and condensation protein B